jgi:hypothetical protein
MSGNFANNGNFHGNVGIFYMLQICNMGQMALLPLRKKPRSGLFRPEKTDDFGRVQACGLEYQRPLC